MALTIVLAVFVAALVFGIIWFIYKKNDADETAIEVPDGFLEMIAATILSRKNGFVDVVAFGCANCRIVFVDDFPTQTVVRIGMNDCRIEMSTQQISNKNYTDQFVFFLLIWCYFSIEIHRKNEIFDAISITLAADEIALDYYLLNRKPVDQLLQGLTELFSNIPSELNVERMQRIRKRINL